VNTLAGDDPLANELSERQMADWRSLRLEPLTDTAVRKRLAELASRIRDAFDQHSPARPAPAPAPSQPVAPAAPANEPVTIVVDPLGRAGPTTIREAIGIAEPGTRIVVQPGLYTEPLTIEKPIELIGKGPREEIVIRVDGGHALDFRAGFGRVANLTLHCAVAGTATAAAVAIWQGRLELDACDLRSDAWACVYVGGGADPRVRANRLHDATGGILIDGQALGTFEDNDVSVNVFAALRRVRRFAGIA
jgi:nitrous oxidase accessory protein NosD